MSLVDYASSSDEDASDAEEQQQHKPEQQIPKQQPPPPLNNRRTISGPSSSSSNQQPEGPAPSLPPPSFEKLPDASLLLDSDTMSVVTGTDHASRVAAAMAESATRKRDSNLLPPSLPRRKIPKGTLPHSKSVMETAGGLLVPPQLGGRSNVVTEDISKLFVRKQAAADPSSQ